MYVQLGGFGQSISLFDNSELAEAVFKALSNGPSLEIILGILPSGASYLLLTRSQAKVVSQYLRRTPPPAQNPERFQSLSPITFANVKELEAELKTRTPKRKQGRSVRDNSQANRSYDESDSSEEHKRICLARSTFEQGRLLRLIFEDNKRSLEHYPLSSVSSLEKVKIISFAYTHWKYDDRLYNERIENPSAKIIDVGFAGANIHDLKPLELKAKHYNNIQNGRLLQGGNAKKVTFLHATTQDVEPDKLSLEVRQFFSDEIQGEAASILLVYDQKKALHAIRDYGVDTGTWKTDGLRDLLYSSSRSRSDRFDRSSLPSRDRGRRSRSRSPHSRGPRQRYSPPEPSRAPQGPVYVLDIKLLSYVLFATDLPSLNKTAERFGISLPDGWNAARDADALIRIYAAMTEGQSIIDWQRDARLGQDQQQPGTSMLATADEEEDPNDIIQRPANGSDEDSEYDDDDSD